MHTRGAKKVHIRGGKCAKRSEVKCSQGKKCIRKYANISEIAKKSRCPGKVIKYIYIFSPYLFVVSGLSVPPIRDLQIRGAHMANKARNGHAQLRRRDLHFLQMRRELSPFQSSAFGLLHQLQPQPSPYQFIWYISPWCARMPDSC